MLIVLALALGEAAVRDGDSDRVGEGERVGDGERKEDLLL